MIGKGETTLVCGATRAFVVTRSDSELRALEWAPGDTAGGPLRSAKWPDASDGDHDLMMAAPRSAGDREGHRGRHRNSGVVLRSQPAFMAEDPPQTEGLALEAIEAAPGVVGLLMIRSIGSAKGC